MCEGGVHACACVCVCVCVCVSVCVFRAEEELQRLHTEIGRQVTHLKSAMKKQEGAYQVCLCVCVCVCVCVCLPLYKLCLRTYCIESAKVHGVPSVHACARARACACVCVCVCVSQSGIDSAENVCASLTACLCACVCVCVSQTGIDSAEDVGDQVRLAFKDVEGAANRISQVGLRIGDRLQVIRLAHTHTHTHTHKQTNTHTHTHTHKHSHVPLLPLRN